MIEGDWGPGTGLFEERLRRSRRRLRVAIGLVPVLMTVSLAAYVFRDLDERRPFLPSLALACLAVGFCLRYPRTRALRPGRWVRTATVVGAIAGLFLSSSAGSLLLPLIDSGNGGRVLGIMVACMAVVAALAGLVSRWLATQAKDALLEPFGVALVHSRVEVPFAARADRKRALVIGPDTITETHRDSDGNSTWKHPLAQVTDAQPAVGQDGGPAVLIAVGGTRLLFPTDHPDRILHLLNVRAQAVAR